MPHNASPLGLWQVTDGDGVLDGVLDGVAVELAWNGMMADFGSTWDPDVRVDPTSVTRDSDREMQSMRDVWQKYDLQERTVLG
jgi:hypothetical protein